MNIVPPGMMKDYPTIRQPHDRCVSFVGSMANLLRTFRVFLQNLHQQIFEGPSRFSRRTLREENCIALCSFIRHCFQVYLQFFKPKFCLLCQHRYLKRILLQSVCSSSLFRRFINSKFAITEYFLLEQTRQPSGWVT